MIRRLIASFASILAVITTLAVTTPAEAGTTPTSQPVSWEAQVPASGTYSVTVSVGDASYTDSSHRITLEGVNVISGFVPTSTSLFKSWTGKVNVSDGRLTVSASGGSNTKIDYITISNKRWAGRYDFGPNGSLIPSGYVSDIGTGYGSKNGLTYGWVLPGTNTPVDVQGNATLRSSTTITDMRLLGFIHMQYPPSAPAALTATLNGSSADLTWTPSVSTVTGYVVYRDGTQMATVTGTTWSDATLAASTTYTYCVRAVSGKTLSTSCSPTAVVTSTGGATDPGAGGTSPTATGPLPFEMPSTSTLRASTKMVFAHYFPPYPISLDNKDSASDYYETGYLNPNGESGKHAAYGGLLRDRPIGRKAATSTTWQVDDMKTEVSQAIAAGIDGFTVDVLTPTTSTNTRLALSPQRMLDAAKSVDPGFKIVMMLDMNGSIATGTTDAIAADIASWKNSASGSSMYQLPDGRVVLSAFKAENWTSTQWKALFTALKTSYGIDVAFMPVFLNFNATNATNFAPFSIGFGNWGNRSTQSNANIANLAATAHSYTCVNSVKCLWFQPVSVQDERPNQGIYDEAGNSENLRATWNAAINGGSDWVQMVTWNDYSEGTQFAPSRNNGWTWLDISSYYLVRFKTGVWSTLTGDALYVSHRIHPYAATPTFAETKLMLLRSGSTPARDTAEVLVMLSSPATVTFTVGSSTYTYSDPAGVTSHVVPLKTGTVSATAARNGVVVQSATSKTTVTATPYVQDMSYRGTGSRR